MRIGIFGGSFDPVHTEHVALATAAVRGLSLDKLIVMPAGVPPHKQNKKSAPAEDRLEMCRVAFAPIKEAEVSDYEIAAEGISYTYLTCRHFRALYPDAELFWLVGTDMYLDFFSWKNPQDILSNATLAVCRRNEDEADFPARQEKFFKTYGKNFAVIPYNGKPVSSTTIRTRLALGLNCAALLPAGVEEYIRKRGLYRVPVIEEGLALEKPSRAEHSRRVCLLAMEKAEKFGIDKDKAFLSSALHDVAKNLPPDDERLKDFISPKDVPMPVLHQFSGAYVLEKSFGVTDGDILNAVRYHTSGRAGMSDLEKLVFVADMLEPGRDFPSVDELRKAFDEDLDKATYLCLLHQVKYLQSCGGEIYPLTLQAYEFYKEKEKQ